MKEIPPKYKRLIGNKVWPKDELSRLIHDYLSSNVATSLEICKEIFGDCRRKSRKLEKITKRLKRLKKDGIVYAVGDDKKYVSLFHLAKVLFDLGPSTKEEVAKAIDLSLDETKSALEQAYKRNFLGKFGRTSNKNPIFYLLIEGEEEKAKLRGIRYAREIYEALGEGYKTSKEIGKILGLSRKEASRILREMKEKVSWLECKKIVGRPSLVWFRRDRKEELRQILEKEKNTLLQKIKAYISKEPRRSKEIMKNFGLSLYETLKLLREMERLNLVRKIEGPGASVTVWYANKAQEIEAKFKSRSLKYGAKLFEILSREFILPGRKIKEELNASLMTTYNLLNRFKKHGLIMNIPNHGWFIEREEIQKILKVVKEGLEGFEIKYEGVYVAIPKKPFFFFALQNIAEEEGIAIEYGNSFILPKNIDWSSYRKFSEIVYSILNEPAPKTSGIRREKRVKKFY